VEVQMAEETFQTWIRDLPSTGKLLVSPIHVFICFSCFLLQFCE